MTILYLGIIIVLLQSYIRLACRHKNLVKEHSYMGQEILKDIKDLKNKCNLDKKSE